MNQNRARHLLESETLELLEPAPEARLQSWLTELYGKPVDITSRQTLRHRDLSFVERLSIADALPESLIYKLVLPPWDIEQDLHERVLIPSVSNSARLFLAAHSGPLTALFLEDLGSDGLLTAVVDSEIVVSLGQDLAKMHRAYSYRIDELRGLGILRTIAPADYPACADTWCRQLADWQLLGDGHAAVLAKLASVLAERFAGERLSLVHGDLYAENILLRGPQFYIIDWSWFTIIGMPLADLATLTSDHFKNGAFHKWHDTVIEAYAYEDARKPEELRALLPYGEALSRLFFLHWLIERRQRGIMGTTVGPVDNLIPQVVLELGTRLNALSG